MKQSYKYYITLSRKKLDLYKSKIVQNNLNTTLLTDVQSYIGEFNSLIIISKNRNSVIPSGSFKSFMSCQAARDFLAVSISLLGLLEPPKLI